MSINAVEGYPLEDFSADAVRAQIAEAQKIASGGGSEQDIAEAKIELEVGTAISGGVASPAFANNRIGSGEPAGCSEIECIEWSRDCAMYINQVSYSQQGCDCRMQHIGTSEYCSF
jgi:hypothetical protein